MYPTIYHALLDLTGLDIPFLKFANSFGFFVAIAFFVAAFTFGKELTRMQEVKLVARTTRTVTYGAPASTWELISNGIFGAVVGFKLVYLLFNYQDATSDPQAFLISAKGSFIGLILGGAFLAWLRYREKQKQLLDKPKTVQEPVTGQEHANNMALLAAIWGFSGAKVFHWLENPDQFMGFISNPAATDLFSGLTMYGGLLVAGPMVIRYMMKNGILPWAGMDAVAPGLMWSYGVGRIGCQVSGDGDWGIANTSPAPSWLPDWMWSYDYPNNVNGVLGPQTGGSTGVRMSGDCFEGYCTHLVPGVYPTPIYETVACIILGFILWHFRKRLQVPGLLFALYLMMNGFERFWIEKIRVNTKVWGDITQAEIISTCLFLLGLGLFIWLKKRGKHTDGATEAD
jgi:prolipoprotein diacylglyceryltransferase